ncbi:MAG: hypothetical protein IPM49_00850 [Flavobacteriales bacterium]|nr:hypothetical protein [Flavobacteriales bacterium]
MERGGRTAERGTWEPGHLPNLTARRLRSMMLLVMLLTGLAAQAQRERFYIRLYGLVTEYFTGDPEKGVLVRVLRDSVPLDETVTRSNGTYEFLLDRGAIYTVWFSRKDLVTKHVRIDAREIPVFPDVPFYEMDVQMTMIQWIEGGDYQVFDLPLGEALYKHSVRNLSWNVEYTERIRPQVAEAMDAYEKLVRKYRPAERRRPAVDRL